MARVQFPTRQTCVIRGVALGPEDPVGVTLYILTVEGTDVLLDHRASGRHLKQTALVALTDQSIAFGQALCTTREMGEERGQRLPMVLPRDLARTNIHFHHPVAQ